MHFKKGMVMKFKAGDKVKFLNDVGEGVIVSFADKKTALVNTSDGFDIPVLLSELVKVGETNGDSGKEKIEEKPAPSVIQSENSESEAGEDSLATDEEIALALTIGGKGGDIIVHLINSSTYHLLYVLSRNVEGEQLMFSHGELEPDTRITLGRIAPVKMDELISLNVDVLFFGNHFYRQLNPKHSNLKFDTTAIFSGEDLKENEYLDQDAAVYTVYSFRDKAKEQYEDKLVSGNLEELIALKEKREEKASSPANVRKPDIEEIDLHIETLVDEYHDLSKGDILDIQMSRFRMTLETAIIHKTRRIVFIHGVGNGRLKHEIRRTLDREYPDLRYQDASFREYGYGATMVIIPQ